MNRLPQIDFLRGIAVILVLLRHHWVGIDSLQHVGWVGVDLFFVLSGFLVSGLLFSEQKKHGNVRPFYFLIRRGFKIYPMFYASLGITYALSFFINIGRFEGLTWKGKMVEFLPEIFFIQNYVPGIWGHHWSLAVEEHFYLLVALCFPLILRYIRFAPVVFITCLALRIWTYDPEHFGETHLRIDSLFMGVCIAYAHYNCDLERFYRKFKPFIVGAIFLVVLFMFDDPLQSWFTKTIGFSLLYLSFGSLLLVFLYEDLSKWMWKPILTIGFYSYGIYLFHLYLTQFVVGDTYLWDRPYEFSWDVIPSFLIFFFGSIALGIGMSRLIEVPFLRIRDKYFPRRVVTSD
jgi:peptidoglycan/LPS O-acetylase OafA/YrhL